MRFGSVAGGGRYDGLVGRFRAEPVPATGFSIGVSRLFSALQLVGSPLLAGVETPGPVVVLVLDRENMADYQRLVALLRADGIRAELYLGAAGMKAQMKYADRRRAPVAVIQGSNERLAGEVQIKDLIAGAQAAESIASNAEWKAARPAQVSCPEADMVAQVRAVLARHFPVHRRLRRRGRRVRRRTRRLRRRCRRRYRGESGRAGCARRSSSCRPGWSSPARRPPGRPVRSPIRLPSAVAARATPGTGSAPVLQRRRRGRPGPDGARPAQARAAAPRARGSAAPGRSEEPSGRPQVRTGTGRRRRRAGRTRATGRSPRPGPGGGRARLVGGAARPTTLSVTALVPEAASETLRTISWVAAPCSSTAAAIERQRPC